MGWSPLRRLAAATRMFVSDCAAKAPGFALPRQVSGMRGALLLTFVFWAVAAAQWPLHDMVVPWDSKNQFYAFFRFMASAIHEGATPFWNPYHYAGHPSVADPQSLIFSPAFVLWAIVDPAPTLFAFDLMVFAHLLVGALAIVRYGQRHAWTPSAAVLAAMVFMIGGAVSSRLTHVGIITAYSLFPLALLWMEIALDRRSMIAAAGFGAVAALIVLGRSQVPLLLCFVLAAFMARHVWVQEKPLRFLASRSPVIALSAITTLVLIAAPMLLTLQFAEFSNRPEMNIELALRSSLYPANLANFFVPDIYGSLQPLSGGVWGPGYFTRPDVDSTDRAFNYLFAGSLTALLFVWRGLIAGRAFARGARMFAAVALLAMTYAFGRYTPLFPFLFNHVPGVDLFRRPVGGTFIFLLALAYLSGALATDYVREGVATRHRATLALGVFVVAAILVWAVAFSARSDKAWFAIREIAEAAPIYLVLGAMLVLPRSPRARAVALSCAVFFTACELLARNAASVLNAEPRSDYAMLEKPTGEAERIVDAIKRDMRVNPDGIGRPRVEIVGLGGPWQNAAMIYGIEATNGYNPLRIGPYDRLVSPGETTYTPLHRRFPASFPGYDCLLGRLLGLEYVVLDRPIEQMPHLAKRTVAEAIVAGPKTWIYRLAKVSPRVTIESRVEVADAADLIDAGKFPAALPPAEVMVDADDKLTQRYGASSSGPAKAKIVAWRPDRIEIDVETHSPAILTLHDPWYPGWQAEVDGVRRPVLRTDVLFRGVELPAGAKKVVFAYRPLSIENLRDAAREALLGE
ncbi:MAG: hypothetical protein KGM42_03945 [Hyphomicrobiales bacterium]|nr:hypothetical protein [Hyphomicrobiales bacterium]